jgi:hypothetical protein
MYEYSSLGPDYGKAKGTANDFEKALEQVWRFAEWCIQRPARGYTVVWHMTPGGLYRHHSEVHLRPDGNATDVEIDRAMRH